MFSIFDKKIYEKEILKKYFLYFRELFEKKEECEIFYDSHIIDKSYEGCFDYLYSRLNRNSNKKIDILCHKSNSRIIELLTFFKQDKNYFTFYKNFHTFFGNNDLNFLSGNNELDLFCLDNSKLFVDFGRYDYDNFVIYNLNIRKLLIFKGWKKDDIANRRMLNFLKNVQNIENLVVHCITDKK